MAAAGSGSDPTTAQQPRRPGGGTAAAPRYLSVAIAALALFAGALVFQDAVTEGNYLAEIERSVALPPWANATLGTAWLVHLQVLHCLQAALGSSVSVSGAPEMCVTLQRRGISVEYRASMPSHLLDPSSAGVH